jgi:hypothetical protein
MKWWNILSCIKITGDVLAEICTPQAVQFG